MNWKIILIGLLVLAVATGSIYMFKTMGSASMPEPALSEIEP